MKPRQLAAAATAEPMQALSWMLVGAPLLSLLFGMAACTPPTNHAVEAARRDVLQAQSSPMVASNASTELNEARKSVVKAEEKLDDDDPKDAEHYARLATTQAETARYRAEADQLKKELTTFQARETTRGIALTLGDVLFEPGSARLTIAAKQNLSPLVGFLRTHPDRAVLIEGHADATGNPTKNLTLSQQRAQAVEAFLVTGGIASSRIGSRGLGESAPVASNATEIGRAENRRVEMTILNPGQTIKISQVVP
jgi:outer membrane protein OmpA-like peptidoglycan-associated protein